MPTTTTAPTATKTTASPATARDAKPRKPLPAPNSDFYYLYETLPAEELAVVKRVREFMETKVALSSLTIGLGINSRSTCCRK